ncbi:amidohydrolase [Halobacteriales archaeon QS_1_68_20]|nr:MAG: amidohydrolase [Halobacteriales archaeon QS_1_68_20]
MDLAIRGTRMVTFRDGRPSVVQGGTVGVRDGRITYVGPDDGFEGRAEREIDGAGHVTMPGLVDAHVHTGPTLLRGAAQDVPEIEWMNRALGPLADHLTDDDRVVGAKLGVLEGIRSGVTTFGEYASDVGRLVEEVYEPWGVRVAATETINAVADDADLDPDVPYPFDERTGRTALDRADALSDDYADSDLVIPTYGPQALDMVPLELLEETFAHAAERDCRVHVHVAQGRRERRQIEARYGDDASTVGVLEDNGLLDERLIAVHCHDATPEERERLAESGAAYVGCPSSIAAIDGVTPPVEWFRRRDAPVGLGTDQAPGPGGHDMLREVRTAALLSKTVHADPTALPAWEALRLATLGGATALGLDDRIGSLEVGKRADLVVIDAADPSVAPVVDEPFSTAVPNLAHSASRAAVDTVVVDGDVVLRDGEFVDVDERDVIDEAQERAERVFEEGAADWRAAGSALVDRADEGWL